MSSKQMNERVNNLEQDEETNQVTDELTAVLEEIVEEPKPEKVKGERVTLIDEHTFLVGERQYRLVRDHREGFDLEKLGERYSEVLARYEYIVGDWGYDQLRLKGFFRADNRRVHPEQRIDALEDYLYEYCNFGCAYFVIERIGGKKEKNNVRRKRKKSGNQASAYIDEKKVSAVNRKKAVIKKRKLDQEKAEKPKEKQPKNISTKEKSKVSFTIRKREE